jgi:hypothetical protein
LLRIVFLVWPDHCGRGPLMLAPSSSVRLKSTALKAGFVPRTGQLLTEYLPQVRAFALHYLQAAQEECLAGRLEL